MNNYLMQKLSKEHFLLSSLIADVGRRSTRIIFHNDPISNVNLLKLDAGVKKGSKIIQHFSDAISIINLDVFAKRICEGASRSFHPWPCERKKLNATG